jgi:zinc protease
MTLQKYLRRLSWLVLVVLTATLVLVFHAPAIAQTPRHYTKLTFPALPDIQLPQYERYQLPNGMVAYLVEDRQLPLVQGTAIFRTGSRLEPGDKVGLAEITGEVMRTGGTLQHPADRLNELLEDQAAIVETSINNTSGTASFNALSEDLDPVFNLFAEVIRSPAFAPEQLELTKTKARGEIARRNDSPGDIASREFKKAIYGESSPYARIPEYATLDRISREDVIDFHKTYIRPDQTILGIVGDFDTKTMKGLIEKAFGTWQAPTNLANTSVPSASQKYQREVFLVDRPDLTQSNILLGHLGGEFNSPDYPALSVLNGVLNGFGGRLFNNVRSRQGLAYSVYGFWSPNYDYPGTFTAGGQTRTQTTVPFIESVLAEIERLRTSPISEAELALAKESILNSFVFNFENPSQTLARLMRYEYFGYPADFIFEYQKAVKATTIEDVQRVAQQYLHPDRIVVLVVGNAQGMQPSLKSLGSPLKTVDVTIPQPKKT